MRAAGTPQGSNSAPVTGAAQRVTPTGRPEGEHLSAEHEGRSTRRKRGGIIQGGSGFDFACAWSRFWRSPRPQAPLRRTTRAHRISAVHRSWNLPVSNDKGEGFENRIAALFAAKLGLPVQSYSFPQRMNFIRNTLRYRLPGEDFRCDIVMSVPVGYDQGRQRALLPVDLCARLPQGPRPRRGPKSGADLFALPAKSGTG